MLTPGPGRFNPWNDPVPTHCIWQWVGRYGQMQKISPPRRDSILRPLSL